MERNGRRLEGYLSDRQCFSRYQPFFSLWTTSLASHPGIQVRKQFKEEWRVSLCRAQAALDIAPFAPHMCLLEE